MLVIVQSERRSQHGLDERQYIYMSGEGHGGFDARELGIKWFVGSCYIEAGKLLYSYCVGMVHCH